ncbi:hypothetical protein DVH05_010580 [Phytophthora capsici]|nr:hypothetical protein DVH05_010580 [Phytophthora capsici]
MALPQACVVCGPRPGVSPESLSKCSRCQAVLYCGREHQSEHFATHKSTCKRVKKMRDQMIKEADKIRNSTEDEWTPANAFETHAGTFWSILSTRPYMRAKLELIRALSTIPSRPALEAALEESMECMRLCRNDNLGIREGIPTFMLMLGQYQEAYDFIKWWLTGGTAFDYDWANMDLPFLDVHDADMTEDLLPTMEDDGNVFFSSSILYIKMKLAEAVQEAINAHQLADRASLPVGLTDSLGAFLAPSGRPQSLGDLKKLHKKLTSQVNESFALTHFQNQNFWYGLLDPMPIVNLPKPPHYEPGDVNEVRLWALQNAMLWRDYHAFIRENRAKYPDFVPKKPDGLGAMKWLHNYH